MWKQLMTHVYTGKLPFIAFCREQFGDIGVDGKYPRELVGWNIQDTII